METKHIRFFRGAFLALILTTPFYALVAWGIWKLFR